MGQSDGFDQVFVQAEGPGHRSPQLRNLQRMREAGAKEVAFVVDEDLCLVNQAPESGGMNNPIPIPLKIAAGWRVGLQIKSTQRFFRVRRIGRAPTVKSFAQGKTPIEETGTNDYL